MRTLSRSLLAVAAVGVVTVSVAAAAVLLAGPRQVTVSASTHADVALAAMSSDAGYWTPARMRHARSADQLATLAYQRTKKAGLLDGLGDLVGIPFVQPSTRAAIPGVKIVAHVGKVFFTLSGVDYVCSGNAVTSRNKDVVATAGHCVNTGPGAYAKNWTFVPGYDDGAAPYGKWAARTLVTTPQWAKKGDINFDTGFAVLGTRAGRHLTDVIGASGVAFSQPKSLTYTLYGYPAGAPFDGETLQECSGKAGKDPYGTSDQGVSCDMTGGSSGGPWLLGTGANGVQHSINSFGYDSVADKMFGPYWGSAIQSAYASASAA